MALKMLLFLMSMNLDGIRNKCYMYFLSIRRGKLSINQD